MEIFAFAYLISPELQIVSAQESSKGCCEKTSNGNVCQEVPEGECNSSWTPSSCSEVDYCKKGCCYSKKTGACNKATPNILCQGGEWKEDANCNIAECTRGCCVIGRNALFVTERACEVKSSFFGLAKDFRPEITNEADCIFLTEKDDEGACVYGESCTFTTKESCKNTEGDFNKGTYCSALNTTCKAKARTGCFDYKVYWFDSCDNREGVKEDCSILNGTMCGLVGTDYKCKSIDCQVTIEGKNVTKKNGESWCEYEGTIGQGRDVPGSRQYRHICFMGEERLEECDDYRNEICVQNDMVLNNGRVFSEAKCKLNEWRTCISYNSKTNAAELCENNPDCFIKNINVDEYFYISFCMPNYPPGFNFSDKDENKSGSAICNIATTDCTYIERKDWDTDWKCVANCKCKSGEFTKQMNDFCTSLGDCGAEANVVGVVTDEGYAVTKAPRLSETFLNSLKKYAEKVPGQKANGSNFFANYTGAESISGITDHPQADNKQLEAVLTVLPISIIIGGAILLAIVAIAGIGDTRKRHLYFGCNPWQPPVGGDDCDKCEQFLSCSDYKCRSLGQECGIINRGTEYERCVNMHPNDVSSQIIMPWYGNITEGYIYDNINDNGFEIKDVEGRCIPEFTNVIFGIRTTDANGKEKPAECVFGNDSMQNFDGMKENFGFFGGNSLLLSNHSSYFGFPSAEALQKEDDKLTPIEIEGLGEKNLYIRCRGVNGKENDAAYVIKSCVRKGPVYPQITKASPANGGYIAYSAEELNATLWVNEPSDCRYSLEDRKYEGMENSLTCQDSLEDYGIDGFACNVTLNVSSATTFYVRCKDKSEWNMTMDESYVYELQRSAEELRIILIDPENGEVVRAPSEPATVNLEVTTAGGAEDGKAICHYEFEGKGWADFFKETNSNRHKQVFNSLIGGDYNVIIECKDIAGNKATGATAFTVYVDNRAPMITRVYYQNGLKMATDEDSTCAYSLVDNKCSFDIKNITDKSNAELMGVTGKEHTAEWQTDQAYYIKCMDEYGNQPGRCSIVVRPYDIKKMP